MPAGPVGLCWRLGSWRNTAWEAGSWVGTVVIQRPVPVGGSGPPPRRVVAVHADVDAVFPAFRCSIRASVRRPVTIEAELALTVDAVGHVVPTDARTLFAVGDLELASSGSGQSQLVRSRRQFEQDAEAYMLDAYYLMLLGKPDA